MKTLGEFIVEKQQDFPHATGELTALLSAIKLGAKIIHRDINKAGLVDILGTNGVSNVQGEAQMKLDLYANEKLKAALKARGEVAGIGSEEEDDIVIFEGDRAENAKYVVLMDPLDGSSNIDVNVSVGTIFSIYHRITPIGQPVTLDDFLQPGNRQVAAGYVVYGSSTMLVYTTGCGVHAFTYDPSLGVFCLSHESVHFPPTGNMYSINEGNYIKFPLGVKNTSSIAKSRMQQLTVLIQLAILALWLRISIVTCSKGGFIFTQVRQVIQMVNYAYFMNATQWHSSRNKRVVKPVMVKIVF